MDWSLSDLLVAVFGLGFGLVGLAAIGYGLSLQRSVAVIERTSRWLDRWLRNRKLLSLERSQGVPLPADLLDGARRARGIELLSLGLAIAATGAVMAAATVRSAPLDPLANAGLWMAGSAWLMYVAGTLGLVASLATLPRSPAPAPARVPLPAHSSRAQDIAVAGGFLMCLVVAAWAQFFPQIHPYALEVEPVPSWMRWLPAALLLPMPIWSAVIVRWLGRIAPRALTEDTDLALRADADLRAHLAQRIYLTRAICTFQLLMAQWFLADGLVNDIVLAALGPAAMFAMLSGAMEPDDGNAPTGALAQ